MKNRLMLGVSAAAMLFAVSAKASDETVAQEQAFEAGNYQGELQNSYTKAAGGDGAKAYAKADGGDGGDAGGSGGHNNHESYSDHYKSRSGSGEGGDGGYAKAYGKGGDGGYAKSRADQDQSQDQYLAGYQRQEVNLPAAFGGNGGGGGAAGPGEGGGDSAAVSGDDNEVQSVEVEDSDNSNVANLGSQAVRNIAGQAMVAVGDGNTLNRDSFNITMRNDTDMRARNDVGPIDLDSGDSEGGKAFGGDQDIHLDADATTKGDGGNAYNKLDDVEGGHGGDGGKSVAVTANIGLQKAKSETESEGGDADSYSDAYGKSYADSYAKSSSKSYAKSYGKADNDVDARVRGKAWADGDSLARRRSESEVEDVSANNDGAADAGGSAELFQEPEADSMAVSESPANADNRTKALSKSEGGDGGDVASTTGNALEQKGKSMSAGGEGGEGGDAKAHQVAKGGDANQMAKAHQEVNALTGDTRGGDAGDISVSFSTGSIGAISLGTLSGIATIAQNTGLGANQFSSFSINAHTNF